MAVGDVCAWHLCVKLVPEGYRKYCCQSHQKMNSVRNVREKQKVRDRMKNSPRGSAAESAQRGPLYHKAIRDGYAKIITLREMPDAEIAEGLGTTTQQVGRIRASLIADEEFDKLAASWFGDGQSLLEDFPAFRARFFRTEKNEPFLTAPFHQRWIDAILHAIETGGQQMILSPPRHGKTELLIHFCVWMICRNPNTRILWIGPNVKRAKQATDAVRQQLMKNEDLKATFLKPGTYWAPQRKGEAGWTPEDFTVSNRTVVGIKGSTMMALSRGGTLDSLDADFIIGDDIESFKSTVTDTMRERTKEWFIVDIGGRKMEETAWITIGSRHHPDDLYQYLLASEQWNPIIETAHDIECDIPETHVNQHTDCVLWADKRSYKWLMSRKDDARSVGMLSLFEMVYYNSPTASSILVFNRADMEACRNFSRNLGEYPNTPMYLVAGLDPSEAGFQAGWLWGFDVANERMYLIDADNERGGGAIPAENLIRDWYEKYGLTHWVVEENAAFKYLRKDRVLDAYVREHSIRLEGTETHGNKHDQRFGVSMMARLYAQQIIDLPFGDSASRGMTELIIRQHLRFTLANNKTVSDLIMASWFPQKVWHRLVHESVAANNEPKFTYDPSFPSYTGSTLNTAPWS